MINAKTKLCCLLGNPVEHSFSPMIHNTLAEHMNRNLAYTAFRVDENQLESAVAGAKALGILGMNITVPHKCNVIPYLVEIDPLAKSIGAVNTLVSTEGGYKGYNTDMIGLGRQLEEEGIVLKDNDVIILGAGGASRAITYLCASKGARIIWLLNRTKSTAQTLAHEVNEQFGQVVVPLTLEEFHEIPQGKYPVIQTSSVGLHPHTDEAPIMDPQFYQLVSQGVDIIFNPSNTRFMQLCQAAGAPAYNGLKMLLYQGVAAFELWNQVEVPKELTDQILLRLEKEIQ